MAEEDDDERKSFISRIGTFFLILASVVLVIFIASDVGETTYYGYFFVSVVLFFMGFLFKRMGAQPSPPSKRFEGLRKMQQKNREAKAKKQADKKKK